MAEVVPLASAWQHESYQSQATTLSESLGLPCIQLNDLADAPYAYVLLFNETGLSIQPCGKKPSGPILVDFVGGAVGHRRQFGGGQGQMIAKACGVGKGVRPRIADVTAGLGRDAFVLASLGCDVQMVERSPIIASLLEDGMQRAQQHPELQPIIERMHLHKAQALDWLRSTANRSEESCPQVIYLDPMFPHRDKSALVKKEMLVFRDLVGADEDADLLLDAALEATECRVVVKRPRKAPYLMNRAPSYQLDGKSSRFDIYALKKLI
ncbi:MAG: SAM-dependent methyltransferase [Oceanospirillales bacterium]|nr:MAG: SAM-dependent methyltransferase [Oceanospirillales bacterium]